MKHASHPQIVARLKRAVGHLNSTIAMIQEGRACLDLAQQLHAVENAIANAKRLLIHDHMDHCLDGSASKRDPRGDLKELKALTKYGAFFSGSGLAEPTTTARAITTTADSTAIPTASLTRPLRRPSEAYGQLSGRL
jgi:DNA-binding FrmR family transcriptional regulator